MKLLHLRQTEPKGARLGGDPTGWGQEMNLTTGGNRLTPDMRGPSQPGWGTKKGPVKIRKITRHVGFSETQPTSRETGPVTCVTERGTPRVSLQQRRRRKKEKITGRGGNSTKGKKGGWNAYT